MRVYLDNAATTSLRPEVMEVMINTMRSDFGNPSSTHKFGREAKAKLENVRKNIAKQTGVNSAEIVFTSCGTEANNLVIRSAVEHLGVKHIITSHLEHKCVANTVSELEQNGKVTVDYLTVLPNGDLDMNELENYLKNSNQKTLVTLMHANNEVGNLYDIQKIGNLAHENNAIFHSDMVQTLGHFPINLNELPVDFASSSAHKYHGPKGVGFLYVKKGTGLKAQITGGGQEKNLRSGTENLHGVIGMGEAFDIAMENYKIESEYIKNLKNYTLQKFQDTFPDIKFNGKSGDLNSSLYTLINVLLPFRDSMLSFELDLKGIAASQGSACSSGATSTSKVLSLLLTEEELENSTPLRISFSHENTKEDIDYLVNSLQKIAQKQKNREISNSVS